MSDRTFDAEAFDGEAFASAAPGPVFDSAGFDLASFDAGPGVAESGAFEASAFDVAAFDAVYDALFDVEVTIVGALPSLAGEIPIAVRFDVTAIGSLPSIHGTVGIVYNSDTQRPVVSSTLGQFQDARFAGAGASAHYQTARPISSSTKSAWQQARQAQRGWGSGWSNAERTSRQVAGRWQDGLPIAVATALRFQRALRAQATRGAAFRDANLLEPRAVLIAFQRGVPASLRRASRYQDAHPVGVGTYITSGKGISVGIARGSRYQDARPLPVGMWVDRGGSGGPGPEPGETIIVPVKRVYVVENHITLHRVDTGASIEADAFSMSLDVDSWTWAWSASLPARAMALIEPSGDGDPVDIETMVNGVAFRLCAESYSRERSFGKARIRVQGRGRSAILDAPYAPTLNHFSAGALTAQQLAALALTINGVGIGWDVAWGLEDWNVPGGTWNVQGSYIAAVQDIVRAAGGYVQPHRTAATLRVLPRYPATPWTWGALTPDFELPSAIASVEGIEWRSLPAYDRVFVGGTTAAGVLGQVTRAGTAGGSVAPMVTHPLITNAIAARQRGLAELANTGRQALVTLRMPVLAETGIIQPGALVRYVDGPTTRLGLVRSTSVSWDRPVLRQTIGLETHVD